MNIILETERLFFSTFTVNDADLVFALNKDPDVVQFTGDMIKDIEQAKEVLESSILPQYALYNHGRWAIHTKSNIEFIGWCGLKARPEIQEIDLGYRFIKSAWGKGFATEAAFASLKYGFEKLGLEKITGRAMPQNRASIRVMEKCGMQYIKDEFVDGHPAKVFQTTKIIFLESFET